MARDEVDAFMTGMRAGARARLEALHAGLEAMHARGLPVRCEPPAGAIYLSVRFDLVGRRTADGAVLADNEAVRRYLLEAAGVAVVPFQAFGTVGDTGWFRLSIGAVSLAQVAAALPRLDEALAAVAGAA